MWFKFHFYDGQAPVQIFAPTRQDAESIVRSQYGANFTFAGSGNDPTNGYRTVSTGSQPQTAQPVTSPPGLQPPSTGIFNSAPGTEASRTFTPEDEALGRSGAFRRALQQRGVDTGTLVGGSLLGQQGQFEDIFDVLQALGRTPGGEQAFQTFAGGQSNPFMAARDLFQEVGGIPAGQANDRVRAIQNPTTAEELGGTARFGQAALRGQVGAFGSNPFLRDLIGRLPDEYAAQSQSQQAATPFFNYLRQRIGL